MVAQVSDSATLGALVTRTLSPVLGAVVESLELEQPQIVTMALLRDLVQRHGIGTDPRLVALRLRQRGWLLATGVRGVWEFAPGAHAGPYGHGDPLGGVKAAALRYPDLRLQVALSTAAWATGHADRVPGRVEVALPLGVRAPAPLSAAARVTRFDARLEPVKVKGAKVHRPETVLVHMAHRPADVRSWESAVEWLPGVAADTDAALVIEELAGRPATTRVRLGYLLQGLRPDVAEPLQSAVKTKTWFGPRGALLRHSQSWQVADTTLPFDPATLRPDEG